VNKIIILIFNMLIYAKVGHSKFVEMHRDASDFYSIFINDTWRKYTGDIERLFKITRRLELRF
jgi:plasmid maintenance system killer protein